MLNANLSKIVIPSDYLTIHKTLYPMRTQVSFKQYNPNIPAKYGLLSKSLNDSHFSYAYQSVVYTSKPREELLKHYITGTENYVKALVNNDISLQGRNI